MEAARRARPSAPGPDGLPCEARRRSPLGAQALEEVTLDLAAGLPPPTDWNEHLVVFLPKGKGASDDAAGAFCSASTTGALSLKSSDCKLVASAINAKLKRTVAATSPEAQRGFLVGRNFLNYITLLDTYARACGFQSKCEHPVVVLYDFGDAFPSLETEWLLKSLSHAGVEDGIFALLASLYWLPTPYVQVAGLQQHFLCITCGPGARMSVQRRALGNCDEPFVKAMQVLLRPCCRSAVGVCADNVGATLQQRALLKGMWHVFRSADVLGGLRLKLHECVTIPLGGEFSPELEKDMRQCLMARVPSWAAMSVAASGEYLGVQVGPAADEHSIWRKAAAKWTLRVLELA
eukprot:2534774-Pyramimonas_sp.AAC.1